MNMTNLIVNVLVFKEDKILALKRKKQNAWTIPEGILNHCETFEECASRLMQEELGLLIDKAEIVGISEEVHKGADKHFIRLYVKSKVKGGVLSINNPQEYIEAKWVPKCQFPEPVFLPARNLFQGNYYRCVTGAIFKNQF